jgi:hypothetical protein
MAVEGRSPTTRERLLARSREELAPHLSLAAVNDASERIVGAISVAATIASGLTLLSAVKLAGVGWGWAVPAIAFSSGAIILAVLAAIPAATVIRPGDLEDVDRFFSGQLRRRGCLLKAAAISLVLALLTIPVPSIVAGLEKETASLGLSAMGQDAYLEIIARGEKLPSGRAELSATSGKERRVLGVADIRSNGVLALSSAVPIRDFSSGARIVVVVASKGHVVARRQASWPGIAK